MALIISNTMMPFIPMQSFLLVLCFRASKRVSYALDASNDAREICCLCTFTMRPVVRFSSCGPRPASEKECSILKDPSDGGKSDRKSNRDAFQRALQKMGEQCDYWGPEAAVMA